MISSRNYSPQAWLIVTSCFPGNHSLDILNSQKASAPTRLSVREYFEENTVLLNFTDVLVQQTFVSSKTTRQMVRTSRDTPQQHCQEPREAMEKDYVNVSTEFFALILF